MDWTAFMFSLPLAAVRSAHLTFAITEICVPMMGDRGLWQPQAYRYFVHRLPGSKQKSAARKHLIESRGLLPASTYQPTPPHDGACTRSVLLPSAGRSAHDNEMVARRHSGSSHSLFPATGGARHPGMTTASRAPPSWKARSENPAPRRRKARIQAPSTSETVLLRRVDRRL